MSLHQGIEIENPKHLERTQYKYKQRAPLGLYNSKMAYRVQVFFCAPLIYPTITSSGLENRCLNVFMNVLSRLKNLSVKSYQRFFQGDSVPNYLSTAIETKTIISTKRSTTILTLHPLRLNLL